MPNGRFTWILEQSSQQSYRRNYIKPFALSASLSILMVSTRYDGIKSTVIMKAAMRGCGGKEFSVPLSRRACICPARCGGKQKEEDFADECIL